MKSTTRSSWQLLLHSRNGVVCLRVPFTKPWFIVTIKILEHWQQSRNLNRRQVHWSQILGAYNFKIIHRKGRLSTKPDALSRRPDLRLGPQTPPPSMLPAKMFVSAAHTQDTTNTQTTKPATSPEHVLLDKHNKMVVPPKLRLGIMQSRHDSPMAGHMGVRKTLDLIQREFWWPGMAKDVIRFIRSCDVCCRSKPDRTKPRGELVPLPVPTSPWTSISMDFITDLPASNGFYLYLHGGGPFFQNGATSFPATRPQTQRLCPPFSFAQIVRLHGFPTDIVSDRGTQFMSHFWENLMEVAGVSLNFSSAFHPEANGQTERVNQIIEQYLRCFCNYQQDNWETLLYTAEFSYNNSIHTSTRQSPFYTIYGPPPPV